MENTPSTLQLPAGNANKNDNGARSSFRKKRAFLFAASSIGLLLLTLGGLWIIGVSPHFLSSKSSSHISQAVYIAIPEIVTNLQGVNGEEPYIKMKVALEISNSNGKARLEKKLPEFIDMFQTYIRSMHPNELQEASGTYRLKEALISRANIISKPIIVKDVLFQEIIVQ